MPPFPAPILAEAPAPAFLMSAAKPLLTFGALLAYGNVVTVKFLPDAQENRVSPAKWAWMFLAGGVAGLAAAIAVPTWWAGFPLMLAAFAGASWLYMRDRAKALEGTKAPPILFFAIDFAKRAADRRAKAAKAVATLRFERKDRTEVAVPEKNDPAFVIYDRLQGLVGAALRARATRIDLMLSPQGLLVQRTVDSIRGRGDPIGPEEATKVADLLKSAASLDPAERRRFQAGKLTVISGEDRVALTVSSVGSMQGEAIRVEFGRDAQLSIGLGDKEKDKGKDTGYSEAQRKLLAGLVEGRRKGVVLFGARPGNGLTNLGLALLEQHDPLTSNVQTLERRVERGIDGVEHQTYDSSKSDYAKQLQSIVRRGPDVVMVTEPGEPGVGKVLCGDGASGTLFYVALPVDGPADMMAAWVKVAGSAEAAAGPLLATVSQRLVRRLCPVCRAPYAPNAAEQKMLGIPAGKQVQLHKQTGKVLAKDQPVDCPTCGGTGFLGVLAAAEVLVLDDAARKLLAAGDAKGAYLQARRACRSPSLQDSALMRVRAGDTSFDEVKRAFAPPAAAKPAATSGAAARAPAAAPAKAPAPKQAP